MRSVYTGKSWLARQGHPTFQASEPPSRLFQDYPVPLANFLYEMFCRPGLARYGG